MITKDRMSSSMREARRRVCVLAVIGLVACCTFYGCATYRTNIPQQTLATKRVDQSRVVWSFFWGIETAKNPITDSDECFGQGLGEVTVKSNLLFDLISVATLGFASPKIVQWHCASPNSTPGVVPESATDLGCDTTADSSCDTLNSGNIFCCVTYTILCGKKHCDTVRVDSADVD